MAFRARIDANPETLEEFEQAWANRYTEGMRLLEEEATRTGGVYLIGYVAEMILKVAYFRFEGAASEASIGTLLHERKFDLATRSLTTDAEGNHSIQFWTELLLVARGQKNRPLSSRSKDELLMYAGSLHVNWKVDMRYHSLRVSGAEWREVKEAVDWFCNYHELLWR